HKPPTTATSPLSLHAALPISHIREHPEHPQYGLADLLSRLGVARSSVEVLPGSEPDRRASMRGALISEALRPASTTHLWSQFIEDRKSTRLNSSHVKISYAGF